MNSGWQQRRDRRRAMRRKRQIARELLRADSQDKLRELETELAQILKAYPPEDWFNPAGL